MFLASPEESEWIHIQTVSLKGNSETISSVGVFFFPFSTLAADEVDAESNKKSNK